tara:strand:+ start:290 stop:646 length:357 start_codon:yes stop_codon:yes gene_type:complete
MKKGDFKVLISGVCAVLLIGYISHNAMVVKKVEVEKIVYEEKEVIVEVDKIVTETITDTLYRPQFVPMYLSINKSEFEEVFRYYREELGPCSTFDWKGELYSTRFKTESKEICSPKIQ